MMQTARNGVMASPALKRLFANLPAVSAEGSNRYSAAPVPGLVEHRIARDAAGHPALLLKSDADPATGHLAPVVVEHLRTLFGAECRITDANGQIETGVFTLVQCTSSELLLQEHFLEIGGPLVASLGSEAEVEQAISHLVELFRGINNPPRSSVQGLWGELLVISRARGPKDVIQAWHATPEDRFDFNSGDQRIEVKTTSGPLRQHHFSLEQLTPPSGSEAIVISMFVETAGAGLSLGALIERVRAIVADDAPLLLTFEQKVRATLAKGWESALDKAFDEQRALDTLAFYNADSVPRVSLPLPAGVTQVHFVADLTAVIPVDRQSLSRLTGLFRASQ